MGTFMMDFFVRTLQNSWKVQLSMLGSPFPTTSACAPCTAVKIVAISHFYSKPLLFQQWPLHILVWIVFANHERTQPLRQSIFGLCSLPKKSQSVAGQTTLSPLSNSHLRKKDSHRQAGSAWGRKQLTRLSKKEWPNVVLCYAGQDVVQCQPGW